MRNRAHRADRRNRASCPSLGRPKRQPANPPAAPKANHTEVKGPKTASIPQKAKKAMIQPETDSINGAPFRELSPEYFLLLLSVFLSVFLSFDLYPYLLLCLAASNISMEAAMAAFKDSTCPAIGILISVSAQAVNSSLRPFPSFPMKNAVPLP